jgi:hypothetical protein
MRGIGDYFLDYYLLPALVGGFLLLLLFLGVFIVASVRTERACLVAGYSGMEIDFTLTGYCTKRVEQTDVVIPVSEIDRGARH